MNTTVHSVAGEAEPRAGASLLKEYSVNEYDGPSEEDEFPTHCYFHNYNEVYNSVRYLVDRTYEKPYLWYFMTFKPFNKNYDVNLKWYRNKGFDHVRKKIGKVKCYIMTKEIMAKKAHINVLCVSERPLDTFLHDTNTKYYRIFCDPCRNRHAALDYIIKESHHRYFTQMLDYQFKG